MGRRAAALRPESPRQPPNLHSIWGIDLITSLCSGKCSRYGPPLKGRCHQFKITPPRKVLRLVSPMTPTYGHSSCLLRGLDEPFPSATFHLLPFPFPSIISIYHIHLVFMPHILPENSPIHAAHLKFYLALLLHPGRMIVTLTGCSLGGRHLWDVVRGSLRHRRLHGEAGELPNDGPETEQPRGKKGRLQAEFHPYWNIR